MKIDYKIMGERIKKARLDKNMTQEDLAEKLEVSTAFLSKIERGNTEINLKRLVEISDILEVQPGYILSGVTENSGSYLHKEFGKLLEACPKDRLRTIYDVIRVLIK